MKSQVFRTVFHKGKCAKGVFLNLWKYQTTEPRTSMPQATPQLGIVISRKTEPLATRRNLWKRRIREAWRLNRSKLKGGAAIVIQAKRSSGLPAGRQGTPSYYQIAAELSELLEKTDSYQ